MRKPIVSKTPVWRAMALVAGIGLAMLSYPAQSAPVSGGDTVQRLYDALLSTMKSPLSKHHWLDVEVVPD